MIKTKLFFIGLGTLVVNHLSQEAVRILKESEAILYCWLQQDSLDFLQKKIGLKKEIFLSFHECYVDGGTDLENYLNIKNFILETCKNRNHVVVLLEGHPLLGVTLSAMFHKLSKREDFEFKVIPGISSFDTMITDLNLDPLELGTCLVDVNRALLFDLQLNPAFNYFFYHICSVAKVETYYTAPLLNDQLEIFSSYLTKYFPNNHRVFLTKSQLSIESRGALIETTIEDLRSCILDIDFATSLFIPGIRPNPNTQMLRHIMGQHKDVLGPLFSEFV
jgi:hypothetical protein